MNRATSYSAIFALFQSTGVNNTWRFSNGNYIIISGYWSKELLFMWVISFLMLVSNRQGTDTANNSSESY